MIWSSGFIAIFLDTLASANMHGTAGLEKQLYEYGYGCFFFSFFILSLDGVYNLGFLLSLYLYCNKHKK